MKNLNLNPVLEEKLVKIKEYLLNAKGKVKFEVIIIAVLTLWSLTSTFAMGYYINERREKINIPYYNAEELKEEITLNQAKNRLMEYQKENKDLREELSVTRRDLSEIRSDKYSINSEAKMLSVKADELKVKNEELISKLNEKEDNYSELSQEFEALSSQYSELSSDYQLALQINDKLEGINESLITMNDGNDKEAEPEENPNPNDLQVIEKPEMDVSADSNVTLN